MGESRKRSLASMLCVLLAGAASALGVDEATVARLTAEMRRSISGPSGQSNEAVLIALRQLRDERLRPLFAEMATRDVVASRLHGIFGLADLSEDGKVNILQVSGLASAPLRARALGAAMAGDYLTPEQMRQVLTWPELEIPMELLVRSRLMREGDEPNVERLREIAAGAGPEEVASRVFAELLLAQAEGDGQARAVRSTLEGLPEEQREAMLGLALGQILTDEMRDLAEFVVAEHPWAMTRAGLRLQALATLLAVAPERGLEEWRAAHEREEELSGRIRLGLVLLRSVEHVEASAFEALIGDELALLDAMGRAGRSVASGEGEVEAMWDLMRQNHEQSLAWIFDVLDGMARERQVPLLRGIMDRWMAERSPGKPVPAAMYEVARTLEASEPGALAAYLGQASARSDAPLCEALLAATMDTRPHAVWEEQHEPAWPNRRSRVLAAIAEARAGRALGEDELELLVSAGMGGESLPPAFRAQAAWLALCQVQKEREALAEVLAPSEE